VVETEPEPTGASLMSEIRFAMVNGTGPPGPEYDDVMKTSFCRQLGDTLGAKSFYMRGPSLMGYEVHHEASEVYRWLKACHEADSTVRLMLAGYSRGGSAAIMACEMLQHDGIHVDSLFLFDAVARHEFPGGSVIPANVRFSRHARRSLASDFVEKYEGTLKGSGLFTGANPIRPLFGNVGLTWRGSGDHRPPRSFMGSHGAIGGVGWRFVTEDTDCEREVADWMNQHLAERGVEARLEPYAPKGEAETTHPSHLEQWLAHNIYQFVTEHQHPQMPEPAGDAR
jgi:hypothetical protein